MQFIRDIYRAGRSQGRPVVSFEFFPPKTEEGEAAFFARTLPAMAALNPDYCSVTYGAGGSTRRKTLEIVDRIQREYGLTAVAHLTCGGSTREEIGGIVTQAAAMGIRNLLALRGDPPAGQTRWQMAEGGFEHAADLVQMLQELGGFSVGVAGFPEGHLECSGGREADWGHLENKIAFGADFVITQLFFDNRHYRAFRDHLVARGVTVPLVPGIIPIVSGAQIKRITSLCGAELPETVRQRLDELGDDDAAVGEFGIEHATRQCRDLLAMGVPGIHFYTLNRSGSTTRILQNLGLVRAG